MAQLTQCIPRAAQDYQRQEQQIAALPMAMDLGSVHIRFEQLVEALRPSPCKAAEHIHELLPQLANEVCLCSRADDEALQLTSPCSTAACIAMQAHHVSSLLLLLAKQESEPQTVACISASCCA